MICLESSPTNICKGCKDALPRLTQSCPICAEPNEHGHVCGACLKKPPNFNQVISPFLLLPPVDSIILRWKERPKHLGIETLINELTEELKQHNFDAVTCVPYHWRRLLKRGRNPVHEMAEHLSRQINRPLLDLVRKPIHIHTQKGLNRQDRQRNLKGAFQLRANRQDIKGMKILLVDDVLTTGATCDQIARLLKSEGATSVTVACLARTPLI